MTADRLPDFVVIGAMKSGSTTLFEHLSHHPDIFMPVKKELDFFVEEVNWPRGRSWYAAQFADAAESAVLGEASPSYTKVASFRGVPKRMHGYIPEARLIYILRDPVIRIKSQYAHEYLTGREQRRPELAITEESGYLDTSLYGKQLQQFRDFYPDNQILVVLTEDMRDDAKSLLTRVHHFLGVSDHIADAKLRANETSGRAGYGRMAAKIRSHQRMLALGQRILPESAYSFVKKRMSHEVGQEELHVPDAVISPFYEHLAADRDLLVSQTGIDVGKWAPLPSG